jgi:tRNA A37 N6-isopentenylltransferase MiaA
MIELLANLDPMTLTTALVGGVGALSTAVVHLYKSQSAMQREVNERLSNEISECRDDRRLLWKAVLKIDPTAEELRNIK